MKKRIKQAILAWTGSFAGIAAAKFAARFAFDRAHDKVLKVIMEDSYDENIWELISAGTRFGWQQIVETSLRSTEGKKIQRPMGTPKKMPNLDDLMFSFAQLYRRPTVLEEPIDTSVTIGKKAGKPFVVSVPCLVAPMAYGTALSKEAKIALAQGAAMANTSTNTGEGPFLPEEREAAKYLIYQYNRGDWGKTADIIRQCDAVEIQIGQGAIGGVGHVLQAKDLDKELRSAFGYPKNKSAVICSRHSEFEAPQDLNKLVEKLKLTGNGAPVGVKIAAGKYLEADLQYICEAGADFISIDGAEAATKASSPVLQDDFGVPLIFAVSRASAWIANNGYQDRITLIVSGRIRTPGDVLKACALGADACYLGSAAIYAMVHTQVLKSLPYEPPTQVVWYNGKNKNQFKVSEGAQYMRRFFSSCKEELDEGIRALGKTSLREVDKNDLMALNEFVAKGCKIPAVYEPFLRN